MLLIFSASKVDGLVKSPSQYNSHVCLHPSFAAKQSPLVKIMANYLPEVLWQDSCGNNGTVQFFRTQITVALAHGETRRNSFIRVFE
jgi:hypothetical protein